MHPLTDYCQRHDIRLYRLAERMGVPHSTLNRLVRLLRRPGPTMMRKIEDATDGEVTASMLFQAHFLPQGQSVCQVGTKDKSGEMKSVPPQNRGAA